MHIMRRLFGLVWPFKWWMGLAVLLGAFTVGSSIGLMATAAFIIAKAALHPSIADLEVAIVGVRFFGIARGVFRYFERLVSHNVTFRLLAQLRVWFYEKIEPLAPARLMTYRSGDLLSLVINDIETLEHFYVQVIAPPAVAVLVAIIMWVFMGSYGARLADTLLAFLLAVGFGVPLVSRWLSRGLGKIIIESRSELNVVLVDGIQGLGDLLAYGQESRQLALAQARSQEVIDAQRRMAHITGLSDALNSLLANLGMVAVIAVAIPMVQAGRFSGVQLAVLALAALSAFEAVLPLSSAAQFLESNVEAAQRLFAIVDATPMVQDRRETLPPPSNYGLQAHNLHFRYAETEQPALNDVSFNLPAGGRLAIVGPSGAGKSTLVSLLLRFWEYQKGQIVLGGHDLRAYRQEDVRRRIAVVSQHTHLFNDTVRANLLLAKPEADQDELYAAARKAQIHKFILSLPDGYDTWIGEQGLLLSGGERQRISIARALLKDAPILVLDEATTNLDVLTERNVLQTIYNAMEGRTTLMITHRLVGMENMDEIIVLRHGKVIERGTHTTLLQQAGFYQRMWQLQNQILPTQVAFASERIQQREMAMNSVSAFS